MKIRDELADILEALDGSDYMDVADAIIARFGVVELPVPDEVSDGNTDEHGHKTWFTSFVRVTTFEDGHTEFDGFYADGVRAESLRASAAALLAAAKYAEARS